ncbi:sphingomyelin phosphodiesterase-like isoform X2 [Bacillus rossius redtenbacheri]
MKSADSIQCQVCMATIKEVLAVYYENRSADALRNITIDLCVTLKIETADVCEGIVDVHLEEVVQLAELANNSTVRRLCGLYNNLCPFEDEWTVDIDLGTKPAVTQHTKVSADDRLTIVHVTDMHYDPAYLEGGNGACGEPTCCRKEQGNASRGDAAAGHWGDYRHCDTPLASVENTLRQIRRQEPKIDYVYMTGDFVDHGVWKASREINSASITKVVNAVKATFPDVPIIFTLGNHEPVPVNQYAPLSASDGVSSRWLYQLVAELWAPYLTDDARKTILSGGYYTLKLRDGFRVVVLNNVAGYSSNFWMALESRDPYGQLAWLAETLLRAERDGEKVHILYHVQMQSCLATWSREYHKIVDRFENIITGQFNGHTHTDEFQVFYSLDDDTRANSVLFNGGSGTANANVNPNYRVYTVDPATWYVHDAETWVFNLTEANLRPGEDPAWYRLYSFREAFGVSSLAPWELEGLVDRLSGDPRLLRQYSRYFVKNADESIAGSCGDDCLKEKLCTVVTTNQESSDHCDRLKAKFDGAQTSGTPSSPALTTQSQSSAQTAQSQSSAQTAQSQSSAQTAQSQSSAQTAQSQSSAQTAQSQSSAQTTQSQSSAQTAQSQSSAQTAQSPNMQTSTVPSTTPGSAFSHVPSKILLCIVLYNLFQ